MLYTVKKKVTIQNRQSSKMIANIHAYILAGFFFLQVLALSGCGRGEEELLVGMEEEKTVETTLEYVSEDSTGDVQPVDIFIDVCGAVSRPGVVRLPAESRVYQAVEAAGGLLPEAASAWINQARVLSDGEQVYVPSVDEVQADTRWESPAAAGSGHAADELPLSSATGLIDINSADLAGLMTLSGIGEAKARAILDYRSATGPFGSIEDIKKVSGIGEGIFAKIKDHITAG